MRRAKWSLQHVATRKFSRFCASSYLRIIGPQRAPPEGSREPHRRTAERREISPAGTMDRGPLSSAGRTHVPR
jgi:hypothetical protein